MSVKSTRKLSREEAETKYVWLKEERDIIRSYNNMIEQKICEEMVEDE